MDVDNAVSTERLPSDKICPLSFANEFDQFEMCKREHCAWWNDDFGACAVGALARVFTRPVVLAER